MSRATETPELAEIAWRRQLQKQQGPAHDFDCECEHIAFIAGWKSAMRTARMLIPIIGDE